MTELTETAIAEYADRARRVEEAVAIRIAGQPDLIKQTLVGMLAGGHILLEGVPGLGKTELVKSFGAAIGIQFARVQFTPDLMPADIVGTQVLEDDEHGHRQFVYRPGPVFTNLLLADEINRATPKTQAALLEAMQERQVTVAGETRRLPEPFLVLATQNPIELEGTYPLPEAQLDRFMFKVGVESPTADVLEEILRRTTSGEALQVPQVADRETILDLIGLTPRIPMAKHLMRYVSELVEATHPGGNTAPSPIKRYVRYGASPRGGQAIVMAAKAAALLDGRLHVTGEDVRWATPSALRHRLVLGYEATAEGVRADVLVKEVLQSVSEPRSQIRGAP
jgi:MoxR-like ATPase